MIPTDTPLKIALDATVHQIESTLVAVVSRVSDSLGVMSQSSSRVAERDLLIAAQLDLRRNAADLHQVFSDDLGRRVGEELSPRSDAGRSLSAANWQTLSLVDDSEMEERMFSDRIGQQISHACDAELRELAAYMGSLLQIGRADQDRNPVRAEVVGTALYRAIESVSQQADLRKLLARELGGAMAKAMPECYAGILRGLQARGIQPVTLRVSQVEGPGNQLPGLNSAYASLLSTRSQHGDLDVATSTGSGSVGAGAASAYEQRTSRGASGMHGMSEPTTSRGSYARSSTGARGGLSAGQADAQLMALLRHLTAVASRPAEFDSTLARGYGGGGVHSGASGSGRLASGAAGSMGPTDKFRASGLPSGAGAHSYSAAEGLTGLMAVNLIRAHREELMQASGGKLDHMVIDVVGSLFDQILSDARVPPQMARQIARLQLPVLRVALNDSSFFSSRRHPVRRFVNRIASLACAFDEFDEGPGKQFLERVRILVQEIVDGDFDQIEIYTAKLTALEAFITDQTHQDAQHQSAVETLGSKETELRLQQRYMLQLQGSLTPLQLPAYLRAFLSQVWSQALVLAVSRDGASSDRATRYRRVGRDIVMSVQPKGSPALRKKFLMQLPPLMKDLNEGLALIGWPEPAQREFLAKLLPAHAESLKGTPQTELDHNMMVKQLETIFATPVPGIEALSPSDAVPEVDADAIARRFSAAEAKSVGLITESAVDWSGAVDIDLGDDTVSGTTTQRDAAAEAVEAADTSQSGLLSGIDVDLSLSYADPSEPTRGPQLMDHIKLGFAYQMHMKDEWQKVRLTHVSAGRSFFVFTRGKKHQETISMTARMLARMCETNRFSAVERTYLMERATHRARKQLAALGAPTRQ